MEFGRHAAPVVFVLHRDASITKRSESILGDFLLDVSPGSPNQPVLQDGGVALEHALS